MLQFFYRRILWRWCFCSRWHERVCWLFNDTKSAACAVPVRRPVMCEICTCLTPIICRTSPLRSINSIGHFVTGPFLRTCVWTARTDSSVGRLPDLQVGLGFKPRSGYTNFFWILRHITQWQGTFLNVGKNQKQTSKQTATFTGLSLKRSIVPECMFLMTQRQRQTSYFSFKLLIFLNANL